MLFRSGLPGFGFEESLTQLCDQLSSHNVKAVIATIPNLTDWPFFTTIPYNGLKLDEEKATSLNQIYGPLGFSFQVGENPFMVEDPNAGMFGVRPAQPGERILLSAPLDSVKCNQMGSIFPFRNEFVLTLDRRCRPSRPRSRRHRRSTPCSGPPRSRRGDSRTAVPWSG